MTSGAGCRLSSSADDTGDDGIRVLTGGQGVADGTSPPAVHAGPSTMINGPSPPPPGAGRSAEQSRAPIKKNTRAAVQVASLNMNGRGAPSAHSPASKWHSVNQFLRDSKVGVLALQETHMTVDLAVDINALHGSSLHVFHSVNPANANSAGVAFVLNKRKTNIVGAQAWEIVPGRALLLSLPWHKEEVMHILNVYAPAANAALNAKFWSDLSEQWTEQELPSPDIVLGDFNLVEDAVDRFPQSEDDARATVNLSDFVTRFKLIDGWRRCYPDAAGFSYPRIAIANRSRIDRIYISPYLYRFATNWSISPAVAIPSDHCLVSCSVTTMTAPYIGPGRWTMPLFLLTDQPFLRSIDALGSTLAADINDMTTNTVDARSPIQARFRKFKDDVITVARARARAKIPAIDRAIRELKARLKIITASAAYLTDVDSMLEAGLIQQRLVSLESRRFLNARAVARAHYRFEGDTISKYWSLINKNKRPRDLIYKLRRPEAVSTYVTRSDRMAELARDYHSDLQDKDMAPLSGDRLSATDAVLESLPRRVSDEQITDLRLSGDLSYADVVEALALAPSGKATGIDGIPYEFWKVMHLRHKTLPPMKVGKRANIVYILWQVFSDVVQCGVVPNTDFALGWLCPLYKKGDIYDVANYRPITLLNADYKLLTKILALKLARVAPSIIHPDQAGFVPGRHLFDQVKLAQTMINYAEATEENGVLIALDQEKAYDRIDHDYLWRTLQAFRFPDSLIAAVQGLYRSAQTIVYINGEASSPFSVTRGVRQGDPMSCLLFDIAIEPLACSLRASSLRGLSIPGAPHRLIATLFADDTTVYLAAADDYSVLDRLLHQW